jgi:hypothetical protein
MIQLLENSDLAASPPRRLSYVSLDEQGQVDYHLMKSAR